MSDMLKAAIERLEWQLSRQTMIDATDSADMRLILAHVSKLEAQLANAKEHLDEFSSFPTVAEGIQAMRIRMLELHAENIRLSTPCPTCGSSLFDCADCVEKQKADLTAKIKALSFCEHGAEFEHLTNCEKCVNSVLDKL